MILLGTYFCRSQTRSVISYFAKVMEEEKEVMGLRFFRVLLPGFSSKLMLPPDFVKKINGRRREVASLMNPNGKMWDVDCHKEVKEVYFGGSSWQDFVRGNNLRVGFFLVFHYKGNMVFSFRAFDLSTREIAYEPVAQNRKRRKEKVVRDRELDIDSVFVVESNGESGEPASKKKRKSKEQSADPAIKVQFDFTVESLTRRRCCIKIPDEISSSCGLSKMRIKKITVEDQRGRKWIVGLQRCSQSHSMYISKGWKEFARANELNVGDKCISDLSLQSKDQLLMKVQINRQNTPTVTPIQSTSEVNSSTGANRSYSSFQTTIKHHNLARNRIYIPVGFVEYNGLSGCSELSLEDSHGQMWLVGLTGKKRVGVRRQNFHMAKGWIEFARSSKLEVGDICTFEMASKDEGNVMRVHVEKKK